MVSFIGAGPGDPELLTIKGKRLIDSADIIIYAGSLVNPQVLALLQSLDLSLFLINKTYLKNQPTSDNKKRALWLH